MKYLSPTDPLHTVRLAQLGSQKAISQLVIRYEPLIHQLAQTMCTYSNTYDTLVQEGRCSILDALKHFDENKSKNFSLYFKRWIRKYMKEHIEKYSTADQYPDPTQTSYIPPVTNDSDSIFHCPTNQLESFPIGETPDYPDFGLKHIIADVLNALPPHHRNLLALRFGLDEQIPMSWGQIAEKMGISEKTAKNTMGYIKRKINRYYPYLRQYQ